MRTLERPSALTASLSEDLCMRSFLSLSWGCAPERILDWKGACLSTTRDARARLLSLRLISQTLAAIAHGQEPRAFFWKIDATDIHLHQNYDLKLNRTAPACPLAPVPCLRLPDRAQKGRQTSVSGTTVREQRCVFFSACVACGYHSEAAAESGNEHVARGQRIRCHNQAYVLALPVWHMLQLFRP